jgi:Dyp-type peroxidase family
VIETGEVQGNVLYAYGEKFSHAKYVLFEITNRADAKRFLGDCIEQVTFGRRPWTATPEGDLNGAAGAGDIPSDLGQLPHLNLAFTFSGLRKLGVPEEFLYAFPKEFREGASARSVENGDRGESAVSHWFEGVGEGDVLVIVHATCEAHIDRFAGDLFRSATGLKKLHELSAARLTPRSERPMATETPEATATRSGLRRPICNTQFDREHFGFADGCSQPAIDGVHDDPTGHGVYAPIALRWWRPLQWLELLFEDLGIRSVARRWRGIRAGEFILGYENEDGVLPEAPPAPLGPNGTFMVYRPMQQHVDAFDSYVEEEARRLGLDRKLLRAKIVGRWPDGTPLTLGPERPDLIVATDRRRANDFLYQEQHDGYWGDPDGHACPLGAHIRRSNPRDGLPGGGERTMRHRIIRRGMPYGHRERDSDRGLVFVCFSASIRDGFEFIQREWLNSGDAFGLGRERDLLLQQGKPNELTGMVLQGPNGSTAVLTPPPRSLVTVRGCEYLFVPSRRACSWLIGAR